MTRNIAQGGSALLILNPFGGDAAFVCNHPRDLGEPSNYEECSIEVALAMLRELELPLVKCEHRLGSFDSWGELFEFLDHSMALPRLIVAADTARAGLWSETVASAFGDVFVAPSSISGLLALL